MKPSIVDQVQSHQLATFSVPNMKSKKKIVCTNDAWDWAHFAGIEDVQASKVGSWRLELPYKMIGVLVVTFRGQKLRFDTS